MQVSISGHVITKITWLKIGFYVTLNLVESITYHIFLFSCDFTMAEIIYLNTICNIMVNSYDIDLNNLQGHINNLLSNCNNKTQCIKDMITYLLKFIDEVFHKYLRIYFFLWLGFSIKYAVLSAMLTADWIKYMIQFYYFVFY